MSVFLIVLLLSNSSLALEILTHGSHQHGSTEMAQHEMHSQSAMGEMGHQGEQSASSSSVEPSIEDCLCDDICCVSSAGFGPGVNEDHIPLLDRGLLGYPNFYSSVSLDLLLPPPTA